MFSVIITEYNTAERTFKYLCDFIDKCSVRDYNFVIVDNSVNHDNYEQLNRRLIDDGYSVESIHHNTSKDAVFLKYSKLDIDVFYYTDFTNNGFAKANNIGAGIAKKQNADINYYLFSNSDIMFNDRLNISEMIDVLESNDTYALIGPKVVGIDGKPQSPCKYINIFKRHIIPYLLWPLNILIPPLRRMSYDADYDARSGEVYRIIGAFMLIKARSFDKVCGFDPNTFLYCEESILSERLASIGCKVFYDPNVEIIHEQGVSTNETINTDKVNIINKKERLFNSEIYYYKNYRNYNNIVITLDKVCFMFYRLKLRILL
jgi:GT2 family glycosyltransferase